MVSVCLFSCSFALGLLQFRIVGLRDLLMFGCCTLDCL